jgi:predicted acetyltransferase
MYTGLYTSHQAELLGLVDGDANAIEEAAAVFAGGTPWMPDFF